MVIETSRASDLRTGLRDVYAQKALSQIPRLLSLEDRNEFSKTYGCFNREYWLCRTLDFPSAIAQFGVHALALAWATPMPENPYYQEEKILAWTLAGIDYWMKIQKDDGSFDEFYPNERGWAGPTGFLLYVMCDTYRLLGDHFPASMRGRFFEAVARAGRFLAKYDEPGVLANHHAMAILPIYEAYHLVKDEKIRQGFEVRLEDFLSYCYPEGWCLEYDGTDLGYLSATVSFLSKLQRIFPDDRLDRVCRRAIDFAAYFAYPNGHYAGSMGSRQTLHFYPHGFEVYGGKGVGLASAVAEHLLLGLSQGTLVPPEIQEDRYFLYRIPELMQSWIDWSERPDPMPPLPFEREPFAHTWPGARIHARKGRDPKGRDYYCLINMAKGGVLKLFRTDKGQSVENDCGFLAALDNDKVVTSQWIDPEYVAQVGEEKLPWKPDVDPAQPNGVVRASDRFEITGQTHFMVMKLFTPVTMIGFRVFMLAVGWQTKLAYDIKGWIRNLLMTKSGQAPLGYRRTIVFGETGLLLEDEIKRMGPSVRRLKLGDEFHVRYVPQSRYFQPQELAMRGHELPPEALARLNREGRLVVRRHIDYHEGQTSIEYSL